MKFLASVVAEMKKVSWPTGPQLRKFTLIVFETSILFAVLFWLYDTGISKLFSLIMK